MVSLSPFHAGKGSCDLSGSFAADVDGLDRILLSLHKEPEEDLFLALVEPQVCKCKALAPDFVTFDSADYGARHYMQRRRVEQNRDALINPPPIAPMKVRSPPAKVPPAGQKSARQCHFFSKATCKFGDACHFAHTQPPAKADE